MRDFLLNFDHQTLKYARLALRAFEFFPLLNNNIFKEALKIRFLLILFVENFNYLIGMTNSVNLTFLKF